MNPGGQLLVAWGPPLFAILGVVVMWLLNRHKTAADIAQAREATEKLRLEMEELRRSRDSKVDQDRAASVASAFSMATEAIGKAEELQRRYEGVCERLEGVEQQLVKARADHQDCERKHAAAIADAETARSAATSSRAEAEGAKSAVSRLVLQIAGLERRIAELEGGNR